MRRAMPSLYPVAPRLRPHLFWRHVPSEGIRTAAKTRQKRAIDRVTGAGESLCDEPQLDGIAAEAVHEKNANPAARKTMPGLLMFRRQKVSSIP